VASQAWKQLPRGTFRLPRNGGPSLLRYLLVELRGNLQTHQSPSPSRWSAMTTLISGQKTAEEESKPRTTEQVIGKTHLGVWQQRGQVCGGVSEAFIE